MIPRFSYKRLFLILFWIGFSAGLIMLNSYLIPNYNNESTSIFITFLCFINASSILTGLVGINKKVNKHEELKWKKDVLEVHKDELEEVKRQIRIHQMIESEKTEQDIQLKEFDENMDRAKMTWRTKQKSDLTAFETYFKLKQSLFFLHLISKMCSILLSLATGFVILNISIVPFYGFILYGLFLLCIAVLIYKGNSIRNQMKQIKEDLS